MVGEGEIEQRSSREHGQRAHLLPEVAKRRNRFGNALDLVEEQQVFRTDRADLRQRLEYAQQIGGIVPGEGAGEIGPPFQVDFCEPSPRAFGE